MRKIRVEDAVAFAQVCAELTRQGIAFDAWGPTLTSERCYLIELQGY